MTWNPEQYLKFAQPRLRPALDLLARIEVSDPKHICDLGCGTGNVTKLLVERWPQASITGVDDSSSMLAQATKDMPAVQWLNQSVVDWKSDQPVDVIYSNAALHWLPNHETLFPDLMTNLDSGGVLAVQMPNNFSAPSHTLIADTVRSRKWNGAFESLLAPDKIAPVADPDFYFSLLAPLTKRIDIWQTEYLQVLAGKDPVKEWTKGTWLKQFLDRLDASEQSAFEEDYARRLRDAYPQQANGKTLFPFKRMFIVLQKA